MIIIDNFIFERKGGRMLLLNNISGQSFKGVYEVNVPKKAFKNPNDIDSCVIETDKTLGGKNKLQQMFDSIFILFGKKPQIQVMTDINGVMIDAEEKEDMHTFSVISGDEKDELLEAFTPKNIFAFMKDNNLTNGRDAIEQIRRKYKWKLKNKPIEKITVNSLEELKEYRDSII